MIVDEKEGDERAAWTVSGRRVSLDVCKISLHFSPLDIFIEKKPFGASVFYATPEVPV